MFTNFVLVTIIIYLLFIYAFFIEGNKTSVTSTAFQDGPQKIPQYFFGEQKSVFDQSWKEDVNGKASCATGINKFSPD